MQPSQSADETEPTVRASELWAWEAPADQVMKDIRRAARRQFSAEEKIRIVLEGVRGAGVDRASSPMPTPFWKRTSAEFSRRIPTSYPWKPVTLSSAAAWKYFGAVARRLRACKASPRSAHNRVFFSAGGLRGRPQPRPLHRQSFAGRLGRARRCGPSAASDRHDQTRLARSPWHRSGPCFAKGHGARRRDDRAA